MDSILARVYQIGIIPVIAIDDAGKAVPLAKALTAGGIPAAEVTFRTAAGEEAIRRIARECPEVLVGAGTILNEEQCDRAIAAGAQFIVSPGYNEALVSHCMERGIPVLPGCVNASDMTRAVNAGLEVVKFFPAEQSGGLEFIKALAPVFPKLRFMPTGGVSTKNVVNYLGYDRIVACGGTWMVKKDLIEGECWEEITRICCEAVHTMLGFELMHVSIHCEDSEQASASAICALLGFERKEGKSAPICFSAVDCMGKPGMGTRGHIAVGTNNIARAEANLRNRGVAFCEESREITAKGTTQAIYLADEFSGFAIHLVQK